MPEYTHNYGIPYPHGNDPIRGNTADNVRTDLRDLAHGADEAAAQARTQAVEDARHEAQPRFALVESLAAEPGSRVVNLVADPSPADPQETFQAINIRTVSAPAPNWARAVASGNGQANLYPYLQGENGLSVFTDVSPGQQVGFTVTLRADLNHDMSATVNVLGYSNGSSQGTVLSDGQHTMSAGQSRRFTNSGVIPSGVDEIRVQITFRTRGETFPTDGHSLYWRMAALYVGNMPDPVEVTTGDGDTSYWLGERNRSGSVTMRPRSSGMSGDMGLQRAAVVDAALKRRGRRIGTGGRAAITLRFDHHLDMFQDKVLPLLEQYRFPWSQMLNAGNFGAGNDNMTPAQIQAMCYQTGGEVWNHSLTHSNITNTAEADREITDGLSQLREELPGLWIDNFVGAGQTNLMGMEGSDTPEKFYGTYPGRLVLAQHAFIQGHYPGTYHRLAGPNLIGAAHHTLDTLSWSSVSGIIRGAVNRGAGLILMLHPNYLDRPGYITTEVLEQAFQLIAQARDDGDAVVLTNTAMLMADSSHSDRGDLLATGDAGSLSGTWSETVTGRSAQVQYGVPHELTVHVRAASAGTTTLSLTETGSAPRFEQQHSISLNAGEFTTLRCLATFPRDTAGITASLSGNVEHSAISLHAV